MDSGGWISGLVSAVAWKAGDPLLKRYGEETMQAHRQTLHEKLLWLRDNGPWLDFPNLITDSVLVSLWLYELRKTLTDADGVLEKWRCQVLRQTEDIGRSHSTAKVRSSRGVLGAVPVMAGPSNDSKVELEDVVHRILKAVEEMIDLFPDISDSSVQSRERPRTRLHFAGEICPIGRDRDAASVIEMLIDCEDKDLQVVSIVGTGGIGKTTLARMVYENARIQQHFPLRLWVTASEDFNTTTILQEIAGVSFQELSLLHCHAQEILYEKRFLLVLDGIWSTNPQKWDKLKISLKCGALGSAVLMTTRSENICSSRAYFLGKLADEYVWSIVKHIAFVDEDEGPDLVHIEEVVVTMCEGIPLSAAILGGLLCSRLDGELDKWLVSWADICDERSVWRTHIHSESCYSHKFQDEIVFHDGELDKWLVSWADMCDERSHERSVWRRKIHSKICYSHANRDEIVFLAIELSYKHLPAYVKGCFAFCSLFPRNHEMDKDMLIQLWMANDLIPSDDVMDLEAKGAWIFDELVSRFFFQDIKHVQLSQSVRTKCRMHDLVYDVAVFFANIEFTTIVSSATVGEPRVQGAHHMSILSCRKHASDIPLHSAPNLRNLRTLVSLEEQYPLSEWNIDYLECNSLRVLDLHGFRSSKVIILSRFLEHLRYLDLSDSWITSIPDDVVHLYNLQTLRLSECCYLSQLPKDLRKMKSLRHLYLDGCFRLENVPPHLGQLKDLHTLTTFIVGTDGGRGIGQLKSLNLEGQLELYNLKNVKRPEDAKGMNLCSKENLRHLTLCWGKFRDGKIIIENAEEVLEALQPPKGLQLLKIWRYEGLAFPQWVVTTSSLQNLIKLFLVNCDRCQKLPPIWCLKSLEHLFIDQMNNIEYICSYSTVDTEECYHTPQAFPKLKEMTLMNMQRLKGWQEAERFEILTLPQLEEMTVINCPMLKMMPVTPMLQHLMVDGANNQQLCSLAVFSVRTEASNFRL